MTLTNDGSNGAMTGLRSQAASPADNLEDDDGDEPVVFRVYAREADRFFARVAASGPQPAAIHEHE